MFDGVFLELLGGLDLDFRARLRLIVADNEDAVVEATSLDVVLNHLQGDGRTGLGLLVFARTESKDASRNHVPDIACMRHVLDRVIEVDDWGFRKRRGPSSLG